MAKKLLKWVVVLGFVGAVLGFGALAGVFWYYGRDLPQMLKREDFDPPQMTRVYSAEGEVIAEYFTPGAKRTVVPLEKIPPSLISSDSRPFAASLKYVNRSSLLSPARAGSKLVSSEQEST